MRKEIENVESLCEIIKDLVLKKRVQGSMEWYIKKAVKNRLIFYFLSFMTIIMPLLTTTINAFEGISDICVKNMVSIFSLLAALSASSLCLSQCQEKWILYRSTVEEMKKVLSLYQAGRMHDEEFYSLIQELEKCMDKEHMRWREMKQKQKKDTNTDVGEN